MRNARPVTAPSAPSGSPPTSVFADMPRLEEEEGDRSEDENLDTARGVDRSEDDEDLNTAAQPDQRQGDGQVSDVTCACCGSRFACQRPCMAPVQDGAKVYTCASSPCSRALAAQIKAAALATRKVHGHSTVGTPWLYARRVVELKDHNRMFLGWCKEWVSDLYGVPASSLHAARTEPHIVKYDHHGMAHKAFKGLGTHQDGSFVTVIMALSEQSEYQGGGTFFPHLDHTVRLAPGEVLLFQGEQGPYSAPHRAQPVSGGRRVLYLAFISLKPRGRGRRGAAATRRMQRVGLSARAVLAPLVRPVTAAGGKASSRVAPA
jgi:hypothetical protein